MEQRSVRRRLYISHFLSTWNSRVFEFGAVLYLASIFPKTLLPMSIYALVRGLSAIVFSSSIGAYIDGHERLPVVRMSIVVQRVAVSLSCIVFWLLSRFDSIHSSVRAFTLLLLALLACLEKIFAIMNLICIEKDWVVVIADDDEETLRDLICKLGGPLTIALLSGWSNEVAIIANLISNCVPVAYEYIAIAQVYRAVPTLQAPKHFDQAEASSDENAASGRSAVTQNRQCMSLWLRDASGYFCHKAFLPSFACAMLYLTVLTFGGQMVTYLLAAGYNSVQIGIARTVSVAVEISATWAAPFVMSRIGAIRSGIWFLNWQFLCLFVASLVFFNVRTPFLAATGLIVGTILSRIGLWGYDLSAQVLIQNEVEAERRGAFASQEAQWQSVFEIVSFSVTIFFSRPDQFRWPVVISCSATASAAALYTYFVRARRGHLVHLSSCMTKDVQDEAGPEAEGLMME